MITLICCLLAIRWAIDQFKKESVLFRESERFDLGLWVRQVVRDRGDTPSVAQAVMCGVLILMVQFVLSLGLSRTSLGSQLVTSAAITQVVAILIPTLLVTFLLTRSARSTLLLRKPKFAAIPAAILLAAALHPGTDLARQALQELYPISPEVQQRLAEMTVNLPPLWVQLLVIAVLPAICEELAFRGFILSGLRHMGHRRLAIVFSSVMFGMVHTVLQQSINACLIGLVIGYIAVQTSSILPGMLFHMTHNGLQLLRGYASDQIGIDELIQHPWLGMIFRLGDTPYLEFQPGVIAAGLVAAIGILAWLHHLPHRMSDEESLQDAIDHQSARPVAS